MRMLEAPVRLCCGQRHVGVVCPDGLVMCCLCFKRFAPDELSLNERGQLQDVCRACAEAEERWQSVICSSCGAKQSLNPRPSSRVCWKCKFADPRWIEPAGEEPK